MYPKDIFDQDCRRCSRLNNFLCEVKQRYPSYHARPVAPFGGANATGRPFTGDFAGLLLYKTLYQFGFSNTPVSKSAADELELRNCRITNAVKCLPPQNKPSTSEIHQCNQFLAAELKKLPEKAVILALGTIAHRAVIKAYGIKLNRAPFAHNAQHVLSDGHTLLDSYHSSRYNIQTKRLTEEMFVGVFYTIEHILKNCK